MTTPDLLRRFGLFVVESFLDARECRGLCGKMRAGRAEKATVFKKVDYVYDENVRRYDENVRRTKTARVTEEARCLVASRLHVIMPDAARHFGLHLTDTEEPQFLIYQPGDFFRLHCDRGPDETTPAHTRRRAVSLVLMLNEQSDEPREEAYGGGSLVLYGLGGDPRLARVGFPVRGAAGLLVAFNSELLHEVTPVAHGERFTVVSWFN